MNAIARASLYYAEGSSDKEYHAEIIEVAGGNVVNFRYGRRGSSLTVGTKTSAPVDFAQTKKIFDKLVEEKTTKGYLLICFIMRMQNASEALYLEGFITKSCSPPVPQTLN